MARYDNSHSNQQLVTQISMHKFHAACQQGMHAINTIHLQHGLWVADRNSSEQHNLPFPSSIKREIMTCDEKGATSANSKSKHSSQTHYVITYMARESMSPLMLFNNSINVLRALESDIHFRTADIFKHVM